MSQTSLVSVSGQGKLSNDMDELAKSRGLARALAIALAKALARGLAMALATALAKALAS